MDRSSLRKWIILSHLTDEGLEDIEYIVVYGRDRYVDRGLSSLFITKNGDVHGTGVNSLVGRGESSLQFSPNEAGELLARHVKVDALCGLGLKKIVVGFDFGAGLSSDNELYVWGELDMEVKDEALVVKYECYQPDKKCPTCQNVYECWKGGGIALNKCKSCGTYPHYTFKSSIPPNTPCRSFLVGTKVRFPCLKCGSRCSLIELHQLVNYCVRCKIFREVAPVRTTGVRKVNLTDSYRVMDIECGRDFLVMKTVSGNLLIWGKIELNYYKGLVDNPDAVLSRSISCGASHVAVVTTDGKLYTCGANPTMNGKTSPCPERECVTLRQVTLPGKVVKACCSATDTICLMANGDVITLGSRRKKRHRWLIAPSNRRGENIIRPVNFPGKYSDIACSPLSNVICAKSEPSIVSSGYSRAERQLKRYSFGYPNFLEALAELPVTFSSRDAIPIAQSKQPFKITSDFASMYSKELFSDFTFKLRDGNFPAHRIVLYSRSNHFKKYFDVNKTTVMDVTSYNPDVYRSLLKYYYGIPDNRQNNDGNLGYHLCDLHNLAVCYNENALIQDTMQKLKDIVSEKTALSLYALGQKHNMDFLVKECSPFMGAYGVWGAYCFEEDN